MPLVPLCRGVLERARPFLALLRSQDLVTLLEKVENLGRELSLTDLSRVQCGSPKA